MIPITAVSFDEEIQESVLAVLRSGSISQGETVAELEARFAELAGTSRAIAVNNGTTALIATLEALGIGPGDEVVVPAFTFVATVNAVLRVGATARLVDISPADFALDPDRAAAAVTPCTAALLPVHLYGQTGAIDKLATFAAEHGLDLVEDAAQAHGAACGGHPAGSFGTGCFSFYATKNLVAGEGGMITTNDEALAERLRLLRNQGMRRRYEYEIVGNNYRMTELAAAVVLPQLGRYGTQVARRRANAAQLTAALEGIDGLELPREIPGREHVWHQYTVQVTGGIGRDGLAAELAEAGIASGVYYPRPIHRYPFYAAHDRVIADATPVADRVAAQCLSLPVHAALTESEVEQVAAAVRAALT